MGCGPLFGWGPMAIFLGAKSYYYHEPALLRNDVEADLIREQYFLPLYNELIANFGNKMSFAEFFDKVMDKCQAIDFSASAQVDLILSNSVLEHIPRAEIQSVIRLLYFVSKPGGYYFHSVDFGSHNIGGSGFGSIYARDRKIEFGKINRLRRSDIQRVLEACGFHPAHSTIYRSDEVDRNKIHESWHTYSDIDLSSRTVLFIGKKAE